jgi:xanthine dehydrogenase accessory factor
VKELTIVILGAGEMASGIAHRLFSSHLTRILMSEIQAPLTVRRHVAFSEAVHTGAKEVEGVRAELADSPAAAQAIWDRRAIAILVDEEGAFLKTIEPDVLIDATMIKRPKGSVKVRAPKAGLVIGVGPGFRAPDQVDAVIESNRGHHLGRVIYEGEAERFTGAPGAIMGVTEERVLRAPHAGMVRPARSIGDIVRKDDVVLYVDETPVRAAIDGVVRGLIRPMAVQRNEKLGDVDPSGDEGRCATISEKARAIAGGVLEAIMHRFNG